MDKLTIINRALVATGQERLAALEDGSDEWIAADTAFERALDYLMAVHQWPFATKMLTLQRVGDGPRVPYIEAYQYPPDCWHLRTVVNTETGQPIPYIIVAHQICLKTVDPAKAVYVTRPDVSSIWHPMANECLTTFVEAQLWSGLAGEPEIGEGVWRRATDMAQQASARVDQQTGARQAKSSRAGAARRTRKIT